MFEKILIVISSLIGIFVIGHLILMLLYGLSSSGKKDFDQMFEEYWGL